jgi:hypothetical protein
MSKNFIVHNLDAGLQGISGIISWHKSSSSTSRKGSLCIALILITNQGEIRKLTDDIANTAATALGKCEYSQ